MAKPVVVLYMVAVYLALLLVLAAGEYSEIPAKIVPQSSSGETMCPIDDEQRATVISEVQDEVRGVLANFTPSTTPSDLPESGPCSDPGWRRVAYLDMTDESTECPPAFATTSYAIRTCGCFGTERGCSSMVFSVEGTQYSKVCGRARAYQWGYNYAFGGYHHGHHDQDIDGYYMDGVSVTHGDPRQHIWTFAGGLSEGHPDTSPTSQCVCDGGTSTAPPFVGDDYFCESASLTQWPTLALYPDDPLWDGEGCIPESDCCQLNNPPWFVRDLPNPTSDDIEVRLCCIDARSSGDVALELLEIYVQ